MARARPGSVGRVKQRTLTAIAAWKCATVELLADALEIPAKQMRRVTKALREAGLVELEGEIICPAPMRVDVDELSAMSRRLAAGGAIEPEVLVRVLAAVKAPAYGGGVGVWSFARQGGQRGVPPVLRADEALLGLVEQVARSASEPIVVETAIGALSRAGVAVPPGLAQLASSAVDAAAPSVPMSSVECVADVPAASADPDDAFAEALGLPCT